MPFTTALTGIERFWPSNCFQKRKKRFCEERCNDHSNHEFLLCGEGAVTWCAYFPKIVLDYFWMFDTFKPRPSVILNLGHLLQDESLRSMQGLADRIKAALNRSESEHGEKLQDSDRPAAYWFLLLANLDCQQWTEAMHCIDRILKDFETGLWDIRLMPEIFHFMALVEFGLRNRDCCARMLKMYGSFANTDDRHECSMNLLALWVDQVSPFKFTEEFDWYIPSLATGCRWFVTDEMYQGFRDYSPHPWLSGQIALWIEDECQGSMDSRPESALEQFDKLKRMGVDQRVTIRYSKEIHPDPEGNGCFPQCVLPLLQYTPRRHPRRKKLHPVHAQLVLPRTIWCYSTPNKMDSL